MRIPWFARATVTASTPVPEAYIVPPQWTAVIERLRAHGVRASRLASDVTVPIEGVRFSDVTWARKPFEGRHTLSYTTRRFPDTRIFRAGSLVVPTAQPMSRVAVHLLDPDGPDALVRWGCMDAVFEQKEYGEDYVIDPIARDMMEKDEKLAQEFRARLAADSAFARSPTERANFFFTRSRWADPEQNVLPVVRALKRPPDAVLGPVSETATR